MIRMDPKNAKIKRKSNRNNETNAKQIATAIAAQRAVIARRRMSRDSSGRGFISSVIFIILSMIDLS